MDDKITVIVPVYNVESYLRKCLDSIIAQTYKNIEIVVVNDGSIEAEGTHEQLMETCPLYVTMYRAHIGALDEA